MLDSYGIELIHPIREGRSPCPIGKKGKSNWRWIVGMQLCWLINDRGAVVAWDWNTANVHDQSFLPLLVPWVGQTIVLADTGFADADGIPDNLKLCPRGTWNERMLVTLVFGLKKVFHRTTRYFAARLAYVTALFNSLLAINRLLHPDASPFELLHLAHFSL